MDTGAYAERRVQGACLAASAALHLALLLALRDATPTLHVLQPAPILVTLYDVGRDAAGPGPLGPELGVDPLTAPALSASAEQASGELAAKPIVASPKPAAPARAPSSEPRPPKAEPRVAAKQAVAPGLATGDSETPQDGGAQRLGPLAGAPGGTGASAPAYAARIRIAYEQQIYLWLERFKRYPQLAQRRRLEGTSTLRVRIDRRGRVLASSLEKPTGQRLLDDAALDMVERAQPFPPIPDGYPGDTFEFLAPVEFRLR